MSFSSARPVPCLAVKVSEDAHQPNAARFWEAPHRGVTGLVRVLTVAASACLAFGASGADNSLQQVFAHMDQTAATFKGMTADIRRVSHEGILNEDDPPDTGTVAVKLSKPHGVQMLYDFQAPDKKIVEIAGTRISIYYPKAAEVQEVNLGKARRAQMEQYLKLAFGSTSRDLQEGYTVEYGGREKIDGQDTARLELTPKSAEVKQQFSKFELWISDKLGIAIQQKFYQPGGTYNVMTYTNVKLEDNLPDSRVKLPSLPKGVKHTILNR
jgi:outer membrane lipoprotein-sorting protein